MSWGPSLAWTQKPHQRRPLGPPRKGIGETRPSGCARKRSSRRSFPLDTADFVRDVLPKPASHRDATQRIKLIPKNKKPLRVREKCGLEALLRTSCPLVL